MCGPAKKRYFIRNYCLMFFIAWLCANFLYQTSYLIPFNVPFFQRGSNGAAHGFKNPEPVGLNCPFQGFLPTQFLSNVAIGSAEILQFQLFFALAVP